MHRYIRMVDKAGRAYGVECGSAVVDGDVHAHALEPDGDVGQLYRIPYSELEHAGVVYLSHDLTNWLASDERAKLHGARSKQHRRRPSQAVSLRDAVSMACRSSEE